MGKRGLIIGANSDLAQNAIEMLSKENELFLHYGTKMDRLNKYESYHNIKIIGKFVTNEEDCRMIVNDVIADGKRLDFLIVFIGGIANVSDWTEAHISDYAKDYELNTLYPFAITKYAHSYINDGGSIIYTSTASACHGGGRDSLGYGMAKSALECLTKRMAKDLAERNISVNAVAPGFMDSEFNIKYKKYSDEQIKSRADMVPMKRTGTREEFAELINYLSVSKSGFITGQVITIDGGDFI